MSSDFRKNQFSRRIFLAGLLSSSATMALAGAPKRSVRPAPRKTIARTAKPGANPAVLEAAQLSGEVAYVVADAKTGQVLESHKPKALMPPASVAKTVTTLYGLSYLGSNYRFRTQVIATGPVENGKVLGDLYLLGGGDPTLDTDGLGALAKRLKEAGIREVSGKTFVHSESIPYQKSIDPDQPIYVGYNPSLSGLNLNYNRVFFEWKRVAKDYTFTMDARGIKYRPHVAMSSMKLVDRRAPIFAMKSSASTDSWTVAKRALGKKGGRWLPVRRPEYYAAEVFQTIARSFGIQLPPFKMARSVPSGSVVAEWKSEELAEVLRKMLKHSTNLTAEAVGMSASQARGGRPKSLKSSARMMTEWVKRTHKTKKAKFVDHSGLGDQSRITASDMVKILTIQGWDGPLHALMKEIPLRDKKGKPKKQQQIKVRAKTGTLNFVSGLAGYFEAPGGRQMVFAFFAADQKQRSKIKKADRERPKGARSWNRRAKVLQQTLIEHWARDYRV